MSEPATAEAPAGTPVAPGIQIESVGTVMQHFPRKEVVSITVSPGKQIQKGDTLLGFVSPGANSPNSRTICAISLQIEHQPVEIAEDGQEVGVLVGRPLFAIGTTVLRVSRQA